MPSKFSPIAVTGVSAIFPGSTDAHGFWRDILAGRDLITEVPASRWLLADHYDPDPKADDKTYCKRGSFLGEIDFDGNGKAIGLHGAIELGPVAADDQAARLEPRSFFRAELGHSLVALGEEVLGEGDFLRGEKRVVFEGPGDGLVEDFHIGQEREEAGIAGEVMGERIDGGAEGGDADSQFGAVGVSEGEAGRRDFFRRLGRSRSRGRRRGLGESRGASEGEQGEGGAEEHGVAGKKHATGGGRAPGLVSHGDLTMAGSPGFPIPRRFRDQILARRALTRTHASFRACLFSVLPAGSSPDFMKPWPAPS